MVLGAAAAACLLPPWAAAASGDGLQRFGLHEGLPQMTVTALAPSADGRLWIGTQEGLARFDGHGFEVFRHRPDDASSLVASSIDAVATDARGRLWVGTNDRGVEVLGAQPRDRWRIGKAQGLPHPTVSQLMAFGAGMLAGGPRGFLLLGVAPIRVQVLQQDAHAVGLARQGERAFGLDRKCRLWLLLPAPARRLPDPFPAPAVCSALLADARGLWVASPEAGLVRLDSEGLRREHWPAAGLGQPAVRISTLAPEAHERQARVLLGAEDGRVLALDPDRLEAPPAPVADAGSRINRIWVSAGGTLWLGTHSAGLLRASPLAAAVRPVPALVAAERKPPPVFALAGRGPLELVGTQQGLYRREADSAWRLVPGIEQAWVRVLAYGTEGDVWVGTMAGLWHLPAHERPQPVRGLGNRPVSDLALQGERLWIATREGLFQLEDGLLSQRDVPAALRRAFLTCLLVASDGALWIGSNEQGLFRLLPDGQLLHPLKPDGDPAGTSVWALRELDGAVHVGLHGEGLIRFALDGTPGWRLRRQQGLANEVVYRIEPDRAGRLWLSTNRGLHRVDPATRSAQPMGPEDGLANLEYNAGASFVDADGHLWFGGTEGLDRIDPAAAGSLQARPRALVTDLVAFTQGSLGRLGERQGAPLPAPVGPLRFDWRQPVLLATLSAVDLDAPGTARLRYRLAGLGGVWIEPAGPRSEILLTGLSPGRHRLEVQAAGAAGRHGPVTALEFEIDPPPWAAPAARLGYALAGLALLAALAFWLLGRNQRRKAQLQHLRSLVAQRTAELDAANRMLRASNRVLEREGRTDPLTQLSNRRELAEWVARRPRPVSASPWLLCMLDLDDFKQVNDRYGHAAGDRVLLSYADRLRAACREHDLVVRWGGEEFLLLLPGLRPADAIPVLDRLLVQAAAPIELGQGQVQAVGCSIGVVPWPFAPFLAKASWETGVQLADLALYQAKREGKGRWQVWEAGADLAPHHVQELLAGTDPRSLPDRILHIRRPPSPAA
ncbi:MAG: GGDEF domain-containing protein [Lysobacteraceae bacterium]|nr:MAG: GGDEF domain-containing protein [Xanthomonadaceae bacterium]